MTYQHSAATRRVLESLVPVICPPEAHHLAADIVDHVALTMSALPAGFRRALVTGIAGYDLAAIPWGRRRAHKLDAAQAEAYYQRWEHGPTPAHVQLARGLAQLLKLGCYEHPAMQAALGYTPQPWIEKVERRRLAVYRADIERHEAALIAPDPLRPGLRVNKERS